MRRTFLLPLIAVIALVAVGIVLWASRSQPTVAIAPAGVTPTKDAGAPAELDPSTPADQLRVVLPSSTPTASAKPMSVGTEAPEQAVLVVRVVSKSDRAPAQGVRIAIHEKEGQSSAWQSVPGSKGDPSHAPLSGADGRVEFTVPPAMPFDVKADGKDDRFGEAGIDTPALAVGEHREIDLELPAGNDLHFFGQVLDRESHQPVQGARVHAMRAIWGTTYDGDQEPARSVGETETNAEGGFELPLASWMNPFVRIEAQGYGVGLADPVKGHDRADQAQIIQMTRGGTLHATIVDASGKPLLDTVLRLEAKGYLVDAGREDGDQGVFSFHSYPPEIWTAKLDRSGSCTITDLIAGIPLDVQIRQGRNSLSKNAETVQLKPGEILDRTWRIGAGCRLEGLVIDQAAKPVKSQEIWLMKQDWPGERYLEEFYSSAVAKKATTDAEGRFTLDDVSPGTWCLSCAPTSYGASPNPDQIAARTQSVTVGTEAFQQVKLIVTRGLFIRGHVLSSTGQPVADTYISGKQKEEFLTINARTTTDGSFALGPLVPGACILWADSNRRDAESDAVPAQPGQDGIELRMRAGGSISGRVVDGGTGLPVSWSAHVHPEHKRETSLGDGFQTGFNAEEGFEFSGLEPDQYDLLFETKEGSFAILSEVTVVAGKDTSGLVATTSPGGKLTVRYEGKRPLVFFNIVCRQARRISGDTVSKDKPSTQNVPAGHLTVEYGSVWGEVPHSVSIDIAPKEAKEIVLHDDV